MRTSLVTLMLRGISANAVREVRAERAKKESQPRAAKKPYQRKYLQVPAMHVVPPDWPRIIDWLWSQGVPKQRIADAIGITRWGLCSLHSGRSAPTYPQGAKLLALREHVERLKA